MREVRQNRKEILRECGSGQDDIGQTVQLNRLIGIVQIEGQPNSPRTMPTGREKAWREQS
jgi:hypothetical protein